MWTIETTVPKNSLASTAAEVILGDGSTRVIELFEEDHGDYRNVDFRGLPQHLSDGDQAWISIVSGLDSRPEDKGALSPEAVRGRETLILFEYAIGARQTLWNGANIQYSDETNDPESEHYRPFGAIN